VLGLTALCSPATADRRIKKNIETKTYSNVEYISESDINQVFFAFIFKYNAHHSVHGKTKRNLKALEG
jgi:hypothetical protein